jgi:hypothetical protein
MPERARAPALTLTRFGAAGRSERRESEGEGPFSGPSCVRAPHEVLSLLRRIQIPAGVDECTRLA